MFMFAINYVCIGGGGKSPLIAETKVRFGQVYFTLKINYN